MSDELASTQEAAHDRLVRLLEAVRAEPSLSERARSLLAEAEHVVAGLRMGEDDLRLQAKAVLQLEAEVVDLHERAELAAALTELGHLVAGPDLLGVLLRGVTRLAAGVLRGGEVGMSLVGRPELEGRIASGGIAGALDGLQRDASSGPCYDAVARGEVVHGSAEEWPVLAAMAAELGIVEVAAIPLNSGGAPPTGALNVYSAAPLSEREIEVLRGAAEQAAVAFENAKLFSSASKLARELSEAFESRGVIEQAKGVLMAREGCDADGAIEILKRASQRENVKLRDIAQRLVDRAAAG